MQMLGGAEITNPISSSISYRPQTGCNSISFSCSFHCQSNAADCCMWASWPASIGSMTWILQSPQSLPWDLPLNRPLDWKRKTYPGQFLCEATVADWLGCTFVYSLQLRGSTVGWGRSWENERMQKYEMESSNYIVPRNNIPLDTVRLVRKINMESSKSIKHLIQANRPVKRLIE